MGYSMDIKKYPYLDALKGLAILAVVLVHSSQYAVPTNELLNRIMKKGMLGVQLFFIVSAIAICMSWYSKMASERFPKLNFYLKRVFRIAPLFYLAIVIFLILNGLKPRYSAPMGVNRWDIFLTATFLHGFNPLTINSLVPGGWSIANEAFFYLLVPFLLSEVRSPVFAILMFFSSLWILKMSEPFIMGLFNYPVNQQYLVRDFCYLNFLAQFPVFLIGIITFCFLKNGIRKVRFYWIGGFIFIITVFRSYLPFGSPLFMPQWVVDAIAISIFVMFLSLHQVVIFVNFVTVKLGRQSYGIYLFHFAIIYLFQKIGLTQYLTGSNFGSLVHFILLVAVSFSVASFIHVLIEEPGIKLGNWFIQRVTLKLKSLGYE